MTRVWRHLWLREGREGVTMKDCSLSCFVVAVLCFLHAIILKLHISGWVVALSFWSRTVALEPGEVYTG